MFEQYEHARQVLLDCDGQKSAQQAAQQAADGADHDSREKPRHRPAGLLEREIPQRIHKSQRQSNQHTQEHPLDARGLDPV